MPFYEAHHRMDAEYFEVESGENFSYPPHVHRCYEAIIGLDGIMEVIVDGVTHRLQRGEVALIFPNQVHALHTPESSRHRLIIFAPEVIAAFDRQHTQQLPSDGVIMQGADNPNFQLLASLEQDDNLFAVKGALYTLCADIERQVRFVEVGRGRGSNVSLLREILNFVQRNFKEECTLASLAATIKYDMTYLSKFFKTNVGLSFTSYVNQVRISHACYLLLNTNKTVLEISHECGSVSLRTFNRNFLEQMGCTPSEYRGR
ncbi:MAG: AraC family transcriptional regulator [Clostridia bacterium]|nr:AraC family transcriptional regulator [Clostridia bacterium]